MMPSTLFGRISDRPAPRRAGFVTDVEIAYAQALAEPWMWIAEGRAPFWRRWPHNLRRRLLLLVGR